MYNESLSYDKNGNIISLLRNGGQDQPINQPVAIDNLTYQYIANTNQLLTVSDTSNSTEGFKDVASLEDYVYDDFGNQTKDDNKGISLIKYNHLNLPTEIIFSTTPTVKKITYLYDASGDKLQKLVTSGTSVVTTDYIDGFQYKDAVLQFFPHAEGYVVNTQTTTINGVRVDNYNYVYNYLDHLGNVRVSYTWDIVTNGLKIIEENGYYPYGLKHSGYNGDLAGHKAVANETKVEVREIPSDGSGTVETSLNQYKFNGQEYQSELALNLYDMDMRDYDPAIGRWLAIDPVTHFSQSPYNAFDGNPVFWADPSGADGIPINTWHYSGSGSGGGAGNLGNGDHMFGGSGDALWMENGLTSSHGAAYEMSFEGHRETAITIDWNSIGSKTVLKFNNGQIVVVTSFFLISFVDQVGPLESDWVTTLEHKYAGMSFGPQPGQGAAIGMEFSSPFFSWGWAAKGVGHLWSRAFGTATTDSMAIVRATGKAGEEAVGITGTKTAILVDGRLRYPDRLTEVFLEEVKNVKHQSFTSQLRDFFQYSQDNNLQMILHTRSTTTFSKPLQELIDNGSIIQQNIPGY